MIGGVIVGGALGMTGSEAAAWRRRKGYRIKSGLGEPWANGNRKWANNGGEWANTAWADGTARRWVNGNRAWANRAWVNGTSKWDNGGNTWINGY